MIDALLADATSAGTPIDGVDGLLNRMTKAVIERALAAEMTTSSATSATTRAARQLGQLAQRPLVEDAVHHERAGDDRGAAVSPRSSSSRRSCRNGPGGSGEIDEMILSPCARGMTTRDIEAHLLEVYGCTPLGS